MIFVNAGPDACCSIANCDGLSDFPNRIFANSTNYKILHNIMCANNISSGEYT